MRRHAHNERQKNRWRNEDIKDMVRWNESNIEDQKMDE